MKIFNVPLDDRQVTLLFAYRDAMRRSGKPVSTNEAFRSIVSLLERDETIAAIANQRDLYRKR